MAIRIHDPAGSGVAAAFIVLGIFLVRNETALAARLKTSDAGVNALRRFCAWVAGQMVARPGFYSLIGVLVVAGLSVVFAGLEPRYRLADQTLPSPDWFSTTV